MSRSVKLLVFLTLTTTVIDGQNFVENSILVDISEQLPSTSCDKIIDNLKVALTSVSQQTYKSFGLAAFNDVIIRTPTSWLSSKCSAQRVPIGSSTLRPLEPEFVVDYRTRGGWDSPSSMQYGGCGVSGRRGVRIPMVMAIKAASRDLELLLFKEWLEYKFGVFSEFGTQKEYNYGTEVLPNAGCENLVGFEESSAGNVTKKFKAICSTEDDYDRDSQTRQNLLCNRRSVHEVVSERIKPTNNSFMIPNFRLVSKSNARQFILVLDVSRRMRGRWEQVRNAVFRFLSQMVNQGDQVAIVTFGSKEKINIRSTVVNDFNREGLFGKIPFSLRKEKVGCVSCGLQAASDIAFAGAEVILLTSSNVKRRPNHNPYNFNLHSISVGAIDGIWSLPGVVYQVPFDPTLTQRSLVDIFTSIVNNGNRKRKIQKFYEEEFKNPTSVISGQFPVEASISGDVWMTLTTEEKEEVQLFEVTSPSGTTYEFPRVENGLFYFNFDQAEVGVWNYRVQVHGQGLIDRTVAVEAFGNDNGVVVEAWTSRMLTDASEVEEKPLIIYAAVMNGAEPVINAQVVAKVHAPGLQKESIEIPLTDDGTGYPDLKQNDGIYSGYFTDFSNLEGGYFVSIEASSLSSTLSGDKLVDNFHRISVAPSFKVVKGLDYIISNGVAQNVDVIPPSRITDLALLNYVGNGTKFATLQWTSPGDDFRNGRASKYEIRCSTKSMDDEEFENNGIKMREELLPRPYASGRIQTATIEIPWENEVFYFAIVAIDDSGNAGKVSNLIALSVEGEDEEYEDDGDLYYDGEMDSFSTKVLEAFNNNDTVVYIISGGVAGFLLMVTIIIIVSICRTRKSAKLQHRRSMERTRVYVNEIDAAKGDETAPVVNYSDVWVTNGSQGQLVVPEVENNCQVMYQRQSEAPTYQNWNAKLPSDDGMTTASSAAHSTSSESDGSDKRALFGTWNTSAYRNGSGFANQSGQRHHSDSFQDPRSLNISEITRKKRQESLV